MKKGILSFITLFSITASAEVYDFSLGAFSANDYKPAEISLDTEKTSTAHERILIDDFLCGFFFFIKKGESNVNLQINMVIANEVRLSSTTVITPNNELDLWDKTNSRRCVATWNK